MKKWSVIGDLHLNKLSKMIPDHLEMQFSTLDTIMRGIKKRDCEAVVLLGDVFDTPIVPLNIMSRMIEFFITHQPMIFHWVKGNHDKNSTMFTSMDFLATILNDMGLDNVHLHINPISIDGVGFLPYPLKDPLPNTNLSFAHVDRPGAKSDSGHVILEEGDWQEDHTFIIGHIHTPQKIGKSYYTGSPYQLSFAEHNDKHVGILDIDDNGNLIKYKRMKVSPIYHLVNVRDELPDYMEDHTYYKIFEDNFNVPDNFYRDNPNCIRAARTQDKVKIEQVFEDVRSSDYDVITPTYGLTSFLEAEGLDESDIAWCEQEVNNVIRELK